MTLCLVVIATGERYWHFIRPLIESANKYLIQHETLLFTDALSDFDVKRVEIAHLGWPKAALLRYHTILTQKDYLTTFDQILHIDVDSYFVAPVGEEVFSNGITAQIHPRFLNREGTFETNPRSTAYVPHGGIYYLAALQGGQSAAFLKMAETLKQNIDTDLSWEYVALWHDESHLNRYLQDNPPAKILSSNYCYPEEWGRFKENDVRIVSPNKDPGVYHGY